MSAFYNKLHGWVQAMLPVEATAYIRDQNSPTPPSPRVTMRVASRTNIAHYRDGVNDEGSQDLTRWFGFTLALEFYGKTLFEAEELAENLQDLCYFDQFRIEHLGREIAFNRFLAGPTTINTLFGAHIEPRVSLDLAMSAVRTASLATDDVAKVIFSGDVQGLTGTRNIDTTVPS